MNHFANTLFTLLFGWLRSLVQGIWSIVASGSLSGFLIWLGDHWIWVVTTLCLGCMAMDYFIWMIRWRPYLVWRTKLRHFLRRLRGEKVDSQRRFNKGYAEGVELNVPDDMPPVYQEFPYDWQAVQMEASAEYDQEEYLPSDEPMDAYPSADGGQPYYEQAAFEEAESPAYLSNLAGGMAEHAGMGRRRRRSDKHDHRKPSWHERLTSDAEDDEGMLDGLPPVVNREQAFHEPVYPDRAPQNYENWQRPQNNQMNGS